MCAISVNWAPVDYLTFPTCTLPLTWGEEWNRAIDNIGTYHRAYILTVVASFGGMFFGWDTGLIGGILTTSAFQKSFALNPKSKDFKNLQGNIVSVSGFPKPLSHVYRLMFVPGTSRRLLLRCGQLVLYR